MAIRWMRNQRLMLAAGAGLLLAACGGGSGGGGSSPPPPTLITKAEAHRFLMQATLGPAEADVQRVIDVGYEAWIDEQLRLPAAKQLTYMRTLPQPNTQDDRMDAWFQSSLKGRDQLRQRMAFALSEIWVVSEISALSEFP